MYSIEVFNVFLHIEIRFATPTLELCTLLPHIFRAYFLSEEHMHINSPEKLKAIAESNGLLAVLLDEEIQIFR